MKSGPYDTKGVTKGVTGQKRCRIEVSGSSDEESIDEVLTKHKQGYKAGKQLDAKDVKDAMDKKASFDHSGDEQNPFSDCEAEGPARANAA